MQSQDTIHSPALPVSPGKQERLAVFIAMTAGYLDVVGYVKLKTYVSFMSGNTTQVAINGAHAEFLATIPALTAIMGFVLGIFTGNCLSIWKPAGSRTRNARIVATLLTCYLLLSELTPLPPVAGIALLSFSVGVMNTIISAVGKLSVNTSFVTGTLNSFAKETAIYIMSKDKEARKEHKKSALYLFLLWRGFLSGGATGVLAIQYTEHWGLVLPIVLLFLAPVFWRAYFREL